MSVLTMLACYYRLQLYFIGEIKTVGAVFGILTRKTGDRPEERLRGLPLKERLAGLTEKEIRTYLEQIQGSKNN